LAYRGGVRSGLGLVGACTGRDLAAGRIQDHDDQTSFLPPDVDAVAVGFPGVRGAATVRGCAPAARGAPGSGR
jgi:hypothetical protein